MMIRETSAKPEKTLRLRKSANEGTRQVPLKTVRRTGLILLFVGEVDGGKTAIPTSIAAAIS
jgi:hypothetical protein